MNNIVKIKYHMIRKQIIIKISRNININQKYKYNQNIRFLNKITPLNNFFFLKNSRYKDFIINQILYPS